METNSMACTRCGGDYNPMKMDNRTFLVCVKCGHVGKEIVPSHADLLSENEKLKAENEKLKRQLKSRTS